MSENHLLQNQQYYNINSLDESYDMSQDQITVGTDQVNMPVFTQKDQTVQKKESLVQTAMPLLLDQKVEAVREDGEKEQEATDYDDTYSNELYLNAPVNFETIDKRDSKRMKAVKAAYDKYISATSHGYESTLTDIDNLDELISACRWYNATRWSLRGRARTRRNAVLSILSEAKKKRAQLQIRLKEFNKKGNKGLADEKREREQLAERAKERNQELIYNDYYAFKDTATVSDWSPISRYWANIKGYTVGFFGRNLLNLGMGAVMGTAWLATYPFARAWGAITKNPKYKKGFNIKVPKPQSPLGWASYYLHHQSHIMKHAVKHQSSAYGLFLTVASIPLHNILEPLWHLMTLDMMHLSGNSFAEPHREERLKKRDNVLAEDYEGTGYRGEKFDYEEDEEEALFKEQGMLPQENSEDVTVGNEGE